MPTRREFLASACVTPLAAVGLQSCASLGGGSIPRGPLEPPPVLCFQNFDAADLKRVMAKALADAASAKNERVLMRLVDGSGRALVQGSPGYTWNIEDAMGVWMVTRPVSSGEGREILRDVLVPTSYVIQHKDPKITLQACMVTGTLLRECPFQLLGYYEDGFAAAEDTNTKRKGYIGTDGRMRIAPRFQHALTFSEGHASVAESERQWGVIDKNGNYVIQPKYQSLSRLTQGWMRFSTPTHLGIVNLKGEEISVPATSTIDWLGKDFALVNGSRNAWTGAVKWPTLISRSGRIQTLDGFVAAFEMPVGFAARKANEAAFRWYDGDLKELYDKPLAEITYGYGNIVPVREGARWGLLGIDRRWHVEPSYDHIGSFSFGMAPFRAKGGAKGGFLRPDGSELVIPGMAGGDCLGHYLFVVHSDKIPAFYNRQGGMIEKVNVFEKG